MPVEEASRVSAPSGAASRDAAVSEFALVVVDGEAAGRRVAIGPVPIVVGRGVGVDLQVSDLTVSRHHCVVWCTAGRCWVRDLGSTNPTRVNNRPSFVSEIFAGDLIAIGQTALTLMRSPSLPT